jgi:hypothetical protein
MLIYVKTPGGVLALMLESDVKSERLNDKAVNKRLI